MKVRVPITDRHRTVGSDAVGPVERSRVTQGKSVTSSWSAAAGASSYLLQVDDSTAFTVPLVVSQTTTARQFGTSSLARARLSWRVRAIDSSSTAGPWSTVRTITVR